MIPVKSGLKIKIQEIHSYGREILKLLVSSLCPAIFGHNVVKVRCDSLNKKRLFTIFCM